LILSSKTLQENHEHEANLPFFFYHLSKLKYLILIDYVNFQKNDCTKRQYKTRPLYTRSLVLYQSKLKQRYARIRLYNVMQNLPVVPAGTSIVIEPGLFTDVACEVPGGTDKVPTKAPLSLIDAVIVPGPALKISNVP
jgi:hypothetical protein